MRIRSFLFTTANRLDRLDKARASGADCVVLDLEDGVPPAGRAEARSAIAKFLAEDDIALTGVGLRINALSTVDGVRDLGMLLDQHRWPELIVVPKVETAKEIRQVRAVAAECGQVPWIMATLESAPALDDASAILRHCGPKVVVAYGSGDHTAQTGATMSEAGLAWARGQIVNAAAMADLAVVDGICTDFTDDDALRTEAELAREMGFAGKVAIHPGQVARINDTFTPTPQAVDDARALLAASENAGGGAFSFHGKMVDGPLLAQAKRILVALGESDYECTKA